MLRGWKNRDHQQKGKEKKSRCGWKETGGGLERIEEEVKVIAKRGSRLIEWAMMDDAWSILLLSFLSCIYLHANISPTFAKLRLNVEGRSRMPDIFHAGRVHVHVEEEEGWPRLRYYGKSYGR